LLPELAVKPPVAPSDDIVLRRFAEPAPVREIAMYWRRASAFRDFLPRLADVVGTLPKGLLTRR
jgi:LysR family hydrogen peroxide-inducible transcriptional activator